MSVTLPKPRLGSQTLRYARQIRLYFQHWTEYCLVVENRIPITPETTIAGLCVGQLAAAAVRRSIDENELARRVSMAVKLAVCIDVYVDLDRRLARPDVS